MQNCGWVFTDVWFLFFCNSGGGTQSSHMPGIHFTRQPHPQPDISFFKEEFLDLPDFQRDL